MKTKITILTEYVVIEKPSDEYHRAIFGFVVNKVPFLLKWLSIYFSCNYIQSEMGGLVFGTEASGFIFTPMQSLHLPLFSLLMVQ